MAITNSDITSLHLFGEDRAELEIMAKERVRSQSHLLRIAFAFWLANGTPEVPAGFDFGPAGRTLQTAGGGGNFAEIP